MVPKGQAVLAELPGKGGRSRAEVDRLEVCCLGKLVGQGIWRRLPLDRQIFWAGFWKLRHFAILISNNYNQAVTANHKGTKDAQRDSWRAPSFAIFVSCGLASPSSPSSMSHPCLGSTTSARSRRPWAGPSGPVGAVVRAGWLA